MKRLLSISLFLTFTLFISNSALCSVWVYSVTETNPPSTDCTPTSLTVSGDLSANHSFDQSTFTISGSTISINVEYLSGIGIQVITPFTQVVDLGTVPAGTYTVVTYGVLDGVVQSSYSSALTVSACCGTNADFVYPTSICLGEQINLTNSSTGASSQEWFENGSSASTTIDHTITPAASGSIVIKLVTSNGSCQDSAEYTVNVLELPTVTALTPNQTSYCQGQLIEISNNAMNATSFNWSESGSFISAVNTLQIIEANSGIFTYKLVVSNGACSDSLDVSVSVEASPTINNSSASQSSVCLGESIDLTSSSTGATNVEWYENGTFLANGANQMVSPNADGVYAYQVQITAANGCMDSAELIVSVNPLPVIDAFNVSHITLCLGDTLDLTSSSSNATLTKWYENGVSIANTSNHSTTPSPEGIYTYELLVGLGNCFDSMVQIVEVVGLPSVDLGPDTNDCLGPIVLDAGSGMSSYLWQDQSTNQTFTPTTSGTYSVTVTSGNGCSAYDEIEFESCAKIDEDFLRSASLFPNPVTSDLQINFENFEGEINLTVSDLNGKQCVNQNFVTSGIINLELNELSAGIYYLQLKSGNSAKVFKIVKD